MCQAAINRAVHSFYRRGSQHVMGLDFAAERQVIARAVVAKTGLGQRKMSSCHVGRQLCSTIDDVGLDASVGGCTACHV